MYQTIYDHISARLTELGFANVGPAFGKTPALPACQIWLGEDNLLANQPVEHREHTWVVQITIPHSDTDGVAQSGAHTLLDDFRAGFYRYRPSGAAGYNGGWAVSKMQLADYTYGSPVIYLAALSIRVFPSKF